jgi:hypothetical protein
LGKTEERAGRKKHQYRSTSIGTEKALAEVDWKKIDEELNSGVKQEEQELRIKKAYLERLNKYQKERIQQQQSNQQRTQVIVTDRLMQNAELVNAKTIVKKRKQLRR